ncbi:MAG: NAD(P)H-dependent oxidoreductase [Gluconobacter sp.]|uniref:FMN-dependent NADH-azoreductase n=1 Tax=Gluconobacter sp. TaxID=1876758 RepID=UPI0039EAFD98
MQILHIDCSPRPDGQSRLVSAGIVARLSPLWPGATVVMRDISTLSPPDADYATLLTSPPQNSGSTVQGSTALSDILIREIETADVLVVGTPVHNFTVPAALKSWLDHVARVNRTFTVGPSGKVGLVKDRPVFIGVAAGGMIFGDGAQQPDFFTPYLKAILNCIGLYDLRFVSVQGTAVRCKSEQDAELKQVLSDLKCGFFAEHQAQQENLQIGDNA